MDSLDCNRNVWLFFTCPKYGNYKCSWTCIILEYFVDFPYSFLWQYISPQSIWTNFLDVTCEQCTSWSIDKVRVLLDELISSFKANWQPSQNLSVDETMIGFHGRFGAKQYIPNKPTKYGVKAFTLADSLNGYILDILRSRYITKCSPYISTNASTSKNCSAFDKRLLKSRSYHLYRSLLY